MTRIANLIKNWLGQDGVIDQILGDATIVANFRPMAEAWYEENDPATLLQAQQDALQAQIDDLTSQQTDLQTQMAQLSINKLTPPKQIAP